MSTQTPIAAPARPYHDVAVMGDGTTTRSRARSRWHRMRWVLAIVGIIVSVGIVTSLISARTSVVALAPDNPNDGGARALAQILGDQGVQIEYVRSLGDAITLAHADTTLMVVTTTGLFGDQITELADVDADLVIIQPTGYQVAGLTGGAITPSSRSGNGLQTAGCDDPDAVAAEEISTTAPFLASSGQNATTCFGSEGEGIYAAITRGERSIVVINDSSLMRNDQLDSAGNAALMLRTLGHNEHLTWYIPTPTAADTDTATGPSVSDLIPSWFPVLSAQLFVVVLALALWRGRRLGPVVTEPLPVTVRSVETTLGRGRLYRRASARGHAGAALRAGTALRTASRLGLPRSAGAADVIDALTRATGRPTQQITDLLYGPPPTDDAGLLTLARQLDELESEVHRT